MTPFLIPSVQALVLYFSTTDRSSVAALKAQSAYEEMISLLPFLPDFRFFRTHTNMEGSLPTSTVSGAICRCSQLRSFTYQSSVRVELLPELSTSPS
jgi:hypothetical protein